jgi:hypothetical protein
MIAIGLVFTNRANDNHPVREKGKLMKAVTAISTTLILVCGLTYAQDTIDVAQDYNAESMLNFCRGDVSDMSPDSQSMICTFRLQGVAEMMLHNCFSRETGFSPAPVLSAQISGSRGAIRQAFVNFMEDNPAMWGEHWSTVVAVAFSENFPCEN